MHEHSHGGHNGNASIVVTAAHATLHCLTGCVVGEILGLAIGVTFGIGVWPTIILATAMSYVSGFTLGLLPVMRRQNKTFWQALKLIWFGEAVSIGVMEIVMNAADYFVGGISVGSIFSPTYWIGLTVAIPAGFLVAWPVNWWLLKRDLRHGH